MRLTIPSRSLVASLAAVKHIVPTRPLNPVEGQVRLLVDENRLVADATDGRLQIRHIANGVEAGDGFDIFPAHRLDDFLEYMPSGMLRLEVDDRRVATLRADAAHYTTPLLSADHIDLFPAFPDPADEGWDHCGDYVASALLTALDRVQYAVGGEGVKEELRMIQILDGAVRAYSGFRFQEVRLGDFEGEVLLHDYAVQPLTRFLRSLPKDAQVTVASHPGKKDEDGKLGEPPRYVFVHGDATAGTVFAVPMPAIPFVDLTRVYEVAAEQFEDASRVTVDRDNLMHAVQAARLQASPESMTVSLKLGKPLEVTAQIDDANQFLHVVDVQSFEGEEGRTVTASIDDLLGLLGAFAGSPVDLYFASAKHSRSTTMPMIQTREDKTDAIGIISQS